MSDFYKGGVGYATEFRQVWLLTLFPVHNHTPLLVVGCGRGFLVGARCGPRVTWAVPRALFQASGQP